MIRRRPIAWALFFAAVLSSCSALADAYDPPSGYYSTATGTDTVLKGQLHNIIDGHTTRSYDQIRADLQVTDVDPNNSSRIIIIYNNRVSIAKPIGGSPPGWDLGVTWNREHSWPQNRGVDSTSAPDGTDLFHMFPSDPQENSTRGNLNYGGVFGAQSFGVLSDGGTKYYPGDLDAGMAARAEFYMAVRYDGADSGTEDLELATGNPADSGSQLGDLNRLLEWHFAAPPDTYERRRNQVIYDDYQHNRNPFIDHPEYAWSVFSDDALGVVTGNKSRISIAGTTVNSDGSSTRNVDLGRVFVGASVPAAQSFTLNKAGPGATLDSHGTYFEVTTAGAATSSITGRLNAFRHRQDDNTSISVGLNTATSTAGVKSGTVTVNNLDITSGGGTGRGVNDANDVFNVSLTVLGHATPSYGLTGVISSLTHDFGNIAIDGTAPTFDFTVFNLGSGTPTSNMDFDSVTPSGSSSAFTTNLAASAGSLSIPADFVGHTFSSALNLSSVGTFSAIYTLMFSDENIAGALNKSLMLTLTGTVRLPGDYNNDGAVSAADYTVWRQTYGTSATAYSGADGDGNGTIGDGDLTVWRAHFGDVAPGAGLGVSAAVPEPAAIWLTIAGVTVALGRRAPRRAVFAVA